MIPRTSPLPLYSLLPLCSLLFLVACGSAETVACTNEYWDGTVGTCLPEKWHVIDRAELDERGAPVEVAVAFQADEPTAGQFVTVTVTKETLLQAMDSALYSKKSITSIEAIPGYEKQDEKEVEIDGSTVTLITFQAKPIDDQPAGTFLQVSFAQETTGYTYTAAAPIAADDAVIAQMTTILEHATLQEKQ